MQRLLGTRSMCLVCTDALHPHYGFEVVARVKMPISQTRKPRPAVTASRSHSYSVMAQFRTWAACLLALLSLKLQTGDRLGGTPAVWLHLWTGHRQGPLLSGSTFDRALERNLELRPVLSSAFLDAEVTALTGQTVTKVPRGVRRRETLTSQSDLLFVVVVQLPDGPCHNDGERDT